MPVALVVHHGGRPGPPGPPTVTFVPSQCDMALGVGSQCGLGGLGRRICGLRTGSEGCVAALHYRMTSERKEIVQVLQLSLYYSHNHLQTVLEVLNRAERKNMKVCDLRGCSYN